MAACQIRVCQPACSLDWTAALSMTHSSAKVAYAACKRKAQQSPSRATWPMGQRWSPIHLPSARHQPKLQDHEHGASVSHGVPVYSLSLHCSTKLYCLMTEARVCEQLAQGRTRQCSGWDRTRDLQSQVQRPNHYATGLQLCLCHKDAVLYLKIADDALWGESKLTLTGSHITETPSSQLNTI